MQFPFEGDDASDPEQGRFPRILTIGLVCVSLLALVGLWYLLPHRHGVVQEPQAVTSSADTLAKEPDRNEPELTPIAAPSDPPAPITAVTKGTRPRSKPAVAGSTRKSRPPASSDAASPGFDSSVPSVTSKTLDVFGEKYAAVMQTWWTDPDSKAVGQVVQKTDQVVQMSTFLNRSGQGRLAQVLGMTGQVVQMSGCRFARISDAWIHALPVVWMVDYYPENTSVDTRIPFVGSYGGKFVQYDEKDYRQWCGFDVYDSNGDLFEFAFVQKDKYAKTLLDLKEGDPIALKGIVVELRRSKLDERSVTGKYGVICTEIKH